jgi:hypothetical protein
MDKNFLIFGLLNLLWRFELIYISIYVCMIIMFISIYDDVILLWLCLGVHMLYVILCLFIIVSLSYHMITLIRLGIPHFVKLYN